MKKCPDCGNQLNYVDWTLFGLGTGGMYHCDYCNNDYIEDISAWYKKNDKGEYEFLKVTDFKHSGRGIGIENGKIVIFGDSSVTQNLVAPYCSDEITYKKTLDVLEKIDTLDEFFKKQESEDTLLNAWGKLYRIEELVNTILSEELPHTYTAHDFGKLDGKKEVAKKVKELLEDVK